MTRNEKIIIQYNIMIESIENEIGMKIEEDSKTNNTKF